MPELPEVQTTVNGLQLIINKHIVSIKINTIKLRYLVPKNINKAVDKRKILKIYRVAKYIMIDLSNNITLFFHLGMSGRIKLLKIINYRKKKHDHILINLSNNNILVFNDPRKFGFIDVAYTKELRKNKFFLKLGLDPFENTLNKDYLLTKFNNSKSSIKQLLLNQGIITGIGNIYACEILFDAKISPFIPGKDLNDAKVSRLIRSIKKILQNAIVSGGTSLRDYVSVAGTLGNFQNKFKVYNKEGERISRFKIKRIKQCGRSTFFCPGLQKSKFNPIY